MGASSGGNEEPGYVQAVKTRYPSVASFHTAVSIGASISIFLTGFSVTLLVLLLGAGRTRLSDLGAFFASIFLLLTITYLIFATNCSLHLTQVVSADEFGFWDDWSGRLYSLGTASVVGAVTLIVHSLTSGFGWYYSILPIFISSAFVVGWLSFSRARWTWSDPEIRPPNFWHRLRNRWSTLMFVHVTVALGLVVGLKLSGG